MSSTAISLSDLKELLDILAPLAGNWEVFLIALGVSGSERAVIQAQHAHSPNFPTLCLVDGLERWVKSRNSPTYKNIIEALNSKFITDKPLAAQIEGFAQQKSEEGTVQPVKPVPAALPQPLSVDQPTSSGGTSCEPTPPPHQTPTTPDMVLAGAASPPLPSIGLETKGLVDHEPFDKVQALAMHNKLKKSFSSQAARLKHHLKATYTDEMLSEFQYSFIQELPCSVRDEHEKFFHSKSSEISRATTFDELFIHLGTYWDYLNYTLLEGIVDVYGTEEMQEDIESYVKDLEDFRRKTKLGVFLQLERHKIRRKAPPGFSQLVTNHSITRESTLEDIENIRLEVTDEFQLRKFALFVVDIVEGCVTITWFVPSSVIGLLKEGLGKPEVLAKLHIDSVEFFDDVEQSDAPVDSDAELARSLQEQYNQEDLDCGSESPEATFFAVARSGDITRVTRLVGELGVDVNTRTTSDETALMWAAYDGHTDTVQALATLGADIHIKDEDGQTALMWAAKHGHTDTVQALATLGADIHIKDERGRTALMLAAWDGRTDTVQALATLGADIHIKDKAGRTALMSAAWAGHTDTVQALATLGGDIHTKDEAGRTALMWAAWGGHTDTVQALATLGGDIHTKDERGRTALMFAAERGHTDTVQALAALGADLHVHIRDTRDGRTALILAAWGGYTDTVQALAALGGDIHVQDQRGQTALMLAARMGETDTVKALEALGADIHTQDHDGNTALMLALSDDELYSDTAEALIAAGTKLNLQEKATGWTALFFAAKHGSLPLVKLMLESGGADPTIRDKEGSTAYDVASAYGHEDVMEELAKHTPPPHAEASPPPPESTTSSSTAQPTETAQSSSTTQTSKRERVFRAARILAERIEKMALPGRAEKRETGSPLPGPEEGLIIDPSKRQKSNKPGGR